MNIYSDKTLLANIKCVSSLIHIAHTIKVFQSHNNALVHELDPDGVSMKTAIQQIDNTSMTVYDQIIGTEFYSNVFKRLSGNCTVLFNYLLPGNTNKYALIYDGTINNHSKEVIKSITKSRINYDTFDHDKKLYRDIILSAYKSDIKKLLLTSNETINTNKCVINHTIIVVSDGKDPLFIYFIDLSTKNTINLSVHFTKYKVTLYNINQLAIKKMIVDLYQRDRHINAYNISTMYCLP